MISVPSYAEGVYYPRRGYHTEGISPVPAGTDIIAKAPFRALLLGGGGGIRTRVRKTFLTTFYERSSLFDLTLSGGKEHSPVKASSVAVAGYGTLCPLTFTAS